MKLLVESDWRRNWFESLRIPSVGTWTVAYLSVMSTGCLTIFCGGECGGCT